MPNLVAGAWLAVHQILVLLVLTVTALVGGRRILGWLDGLPPLPAAAREEPLAPALRGASSLGALSLRASSPGVLSPGASSLAGIWGLAGTLGLAALGSVGFVLGCLGWLQPWPVALLAVAIHLASWSVWAVLAEEIGRWWRTARPRLVLWVAAAAAVGLAPLFVLTLYPPTAFDATLYHLPYARAFAASGSLPFLPELRIPIFPQLQEVIFAMVLPFGGDLAAQGVTWVETLLTAVLLLAWGRQTSRLAGWLAVAAYVGSPVVIYLAGTAYVEPGLVLFATAALYATDRWRRGGNRSWLIIGALCGGAAAATKYPGLFVPAVVALAAAAGQPPEVTVAGRRDPLWIRLSIVALGAGLVLAPWYGRLLAATGNPLFPFFPGLFGSTPWNPGALRSASSLTERLSQIAVSVLRLPWDVVFARQRLAGTPPFSAVFLLASPLLVAAFVLRRRARRLLLVAAAYSAVIVAWLPVGRYLTLVLPLGCLVLGETLAEVLGLLSAARHPPAPGAEARRAMQRLAVAVALATLLPGWAYAAYRIHHLGALPLTPNRRHAFLRRELPAYGSIRFLNQKCGAAYAVYAVHAENLIYFADGRFLGDWTGITPYQQMIPRNGDSGSLARNLRRVGADHLLLLEGDPGLPGFAQPAFNQLFLQVYGDGRSRLFSLRGAPGTPGTSSYNAPCPALPAAPAGAGPVRRSAPANPQ